SYRRPPCPRARLVQRRLVQRRLVPLGDLRTDDRDDLLADVDRVGEQPGTDLTAVVRGRDAEELNGHGRLLSAHFLLCLSGQSENPRSPPRYSPCPAQRLPAGLVVPLHPFLIAIASSPSRKPPDWCCHSLA